MSAAELEAIQSELDSAEWITLEPAEAEKGKENV